MACVTQIPMRWISLSLCSLHCRYVEGCVYIFLHLWVYVFQLMKHALIMKPKWMGYIICSFVHTKTMYISWSMLNSSLHSQLPCSWHLMSRRVLLCECSCCLRATYDDSQCDKGCRMRINERNECYIRHCRRRFMSFGDGLHINIFPLIWVEKHSKNYVAVIKWDELNLTIWIIME